MSTTLLRDRMIAPRHRVAASRPLSTWFAEPNSELSPWGVVLVFSTWTALVGYVWMEALG